MSEDRNQKRAINCSKDDSEAQNKIVTSHREGFEKIKYEEMEAEIEKYEINMFGGALRPGARIKFQV